MNRPALCLACLPLLLRTTVFGSGMSDPRWGDISQSQAVSVVRSILKDSSAGCKINSVSSVTAARGKAGWRVTAMLYMSASGRRILERAVWIVSKANGAVAQDQITSEIQARCNA